jgi:cytidylate kinase
MIITVSGITASGKTTLAKGLADELNLEFISGSSKLKALLPVKTFNSWESKDGMKMIHLRLKNPVFDKKLDLALLRTIRKSDNIVVDSWTIPWLLKSNDNILKIYVKAPIDVRARRVSVRDNIPYKSALEITKKKDLLTAGVYKKLYKIDVAKDLAPFDLVIDSSKLDKDNLRDLCVDFIFKFFKV